MRNSITPFRAAGARALLAYVHGLMTERVYRRKPERVRPLYQ